MNIFKKVEKKYLIIFGCIILLPIILLFVLFLLQGCGKKVITPEKYEEKMLSAGAEYLKDEVDSLNESDIKTVSLEKLIKDEYIDSYDKLLEDDNCTGSVSVRRNGSQFEENNGGFLNYIVSLECDKYSTNSLKNEIMKDLTTTGSGLYAVNNNHIYKGDTVKNHVNFFGKDYRIISMDSNGILKLIKSESEASGTYWDNKYNIDTNLASGKNIYKDSNILKKILTTYNDIDRFTKSSKQHMISYDVCVDRRDINNNSIQENVECTEVLENQAISLIGVTDFANASLDPNCNSITAKSCRNYNYLKDLYLSTWTYVAVANNSYEVFYLDKGIADVQPANEFYNYNTVIYIDANEKIVEGNGSEAKPYIIK